MAFNKILCIGISESKLEPDYWKRMDKITEKRVMLEKDSTDIKTHLADTDCLLINPFVFKADKDIIDSAPKLKFIEVLATGYGVVDTDYAASKGIAVCNVPGYATESVAELAISIILEHSRDLEHAKHLGRTGDYTDVPRLPVFEIKEKKFGIIGTGRIGSRVVELLLAFGARVSYWSRSRKPELEQKGAVYEKAEKLLSESDFVLLHLALNSETEGFLNEKLIGTIKEGAVLLNLSPNELVDFNSLEKRLTGKNLIYIADHIDEMTPDQAKKMTEYENFVPYPPIGYQTVEATKAKQEIFVANIENFLEGKPSNKVN